MTKKWLLVVGLILFLGGIISFIPNPLFGASSVFELVTLSAIVSILVGGYFIYAAYENQEKHTKLFKIWGIIFAAMAIVGFLFGYSLNLADSWLLLVIAIIFIIISEKIKPAKSVAPSK